MRICIVQPTVPAVSETFLRAHAEQLPGVVSVIHRTQDRHIAIDNVPILSQSTLHRRARQLIRRIRGRDPNWEMTRAYLAALRRTSCDVVLAQYGTSGVAVSEACRLTGTPLVVHFHGYDASIRDLLRREKAAYERLFDQAAALIAVSSPMRERLIGLGAPAEKVVLNPYGVDVGLFSGADPKQSPPHLLAVGRFVEKKAPHLSLLAFSVALKSCRDLRLTFVGDGVLKGICEDIAHALDIADHVTFLGARPHEEIVELMRRARGFVQHSVEARNGDCEGMPVSILEASASGLPVVATRHAGIPEAIKHGETGYLVEERDVAGMARYMVEIATQPGTAERMGKAGREFIRSHFSADDSIRRLTRVLEKAARAPKSPMPDCRPAQVIASKASSHLM